MLLLSVIMLIVAFSYFMVIVIMLSVIMLSVVMLSVVILNAILLNVVAPFNHYASVNGQYFFEHLK